MKVKRLGSSVQLMSRKEIEDLMFQSLSIGGVFEDGTESYGECNATEAEIASLVSRGCNADTLFLVLDRAVDIHVRNLSLTPAKLINSLGNKMRRIAKEIRKVERPWFIAILAEFQSRRPHVEGMKMPNSFGWYGQSELADSLEQEAFLYDEWALLASQKVLPKDVGTPRLARLSVAWYVKHATGKTYFPEVVQLLKRIGLGEVTTTQLSRELKDFERNYPLCRAALKEFVQDVERRKRLGLNVSVKELPPAPQI